MTPRRQVQPSSHPHWAGLLDGYVEALRGRRCLVSLFQ
uniref:Uncharacterized protein n=1 Tax=Anguilla anguilla TaxID=7936 RepID=A0A0E9VQ06_ANGAN